MRCAVIHSRILHGAAFAAALLLSTGLLLQKAAAATTLTWQASPSSPNIDGYRVYYGTSSGNYSQHADVPGTGTTATVASAPAGSTYYYTAVAYKGALESIGSNEVMRSTPGGTPTPTPTPYSDSTPSPTRHQLLVRRPTPNRVLRLHQLRLRLPNRALLPRPTPTPTPKPSPTPTPTPTPTSPTPTPTPTDSTPKPSPRLHPHHSDSQHRALHQRLPDPIQRPQLHRRLPRRHRHYADNRPPPTVQRQLQRQLLLADAYSHSHRHSSPFFNTRRHSYADTDAKEEIWEGPLSASFAYANSNSLITSSTAHAVRRGGYLRIGD